MTNYLDKRFENQEHQDSLEASGWGDYLKLLSLMTMNRKSTK